MPLDNSEYQPHVPDAVRRQAARADELARENGIAGVPELETLTEEPVEPAEPAEPSLETTPEPAPPADPPVDWEQRYRTLQGKYDAEIGQVHDLRRQIDSMRLLLAQVNAPRTPEPVAEARPATTTTVVPAEHVEAYGQDLIDAARQWARAEIAPELEQLRGELRDLRGGQQQTAQQQAQQRVEAQLSADPQLADKWQALNQDQEFIAWLNQVDPYTGAPRMEFFRDACSRGDGVRVGRFFKGYIAEHTAVSQPSPTPQPQTPAEPVAERPSLEGLAAPGRAVGTGSPQGGAPAEKRLWTNDQIARFYRDRMHGVYEGREAEARALELDILAAAGEGRIR